MMKLIKFLKNKVFKRNSYSVPEFIKKYKIDEMSEDKMESKLLEIIYSENRIFCHAQKDKEIAMMLMGNHEQDKERIKEKKTL